MQLHQRGVDLLVDVQDTTDHIDSLTAGEMRSLLKEVSIVLGLLLDRDIPLVGPGSGQPETRAWHRDHE